MVEDNSDLRTSGASTMRSLSILNTSVCLMATLICESAPAAQPPSTTPEPSIRLLTPQFDEAERGTTVGQPPQTGNPSAGTPQPGVPSPAADARQQINRPQPDALNPAGPANAAGAGASRQRTPATGTSRRRPRTTSRGRIRLARAPNMFGDFFQTPPALTFVLPQTSDSGLSQPEILSPIPGEIQNPMIGGGPRLKISDNFSPIPRHRIFVQTHYFHELYRAEIADSTNPSLGQFSRRESLFLTTIGAEFLLPQDNASLELRLPMIGAPSTNSLLVDPVFGPTASQSASREVFGNLSVIYKRVLRENQNALLSGGLGLSIPIAGDVKGNLADVDYVITNETLNIIPFLSLLTAPRDDVFFQLHAQLDIPVDDDDFFFQEQPSFFLTGSPRSGRFGSYRESILASIDAQLGWQMYRQPRGAFLRSVSGVLECRATTALTPSTAPGGIAGELLGETDTAVVVDLQDVDSQPTYVNFTFGLQLQLAESWHLRAGHVIPLINNGGFRSESMLQLERRF